MSKLLSKAKEIAELKALREQRSIAIVEDGGLSMVPLEKWDGDALFVFDPPEAAEQSHEPYEDRRPEVGDQVLVQDSDVEVAVITRESPMRIFTESGESFRKSDGVIWGGGEKRILGAVV